VRESRNKKNKKDGGGRGRVREEENKNIKKWGGRGTMRERENKKFPCRFCIHQSLCHMKWEREKEGKKNVPRIPL
jgi:hypothetical protein